MSDRDAAETAIRLDQVDETPVGETGNDERTDGAECLLVIERTTE